MSSFFYPNKGEKREYHLMKLLVNLLIFLLMHSGCASSEQHAKKGDKTDLSTDEADDTKDNSDK